VGPDDEGQVLRSHVRTEASLLLGASDDPYAPLAACGLGLIMVLAAITHALLPELR
jgi:hypothetical protein